MSKMLQYKNFWQNQGQALPMSHLHSPIDCRTKSNWTKSIAPRHKVTGQKVSDIGQKVFQFFYLGLFLYI